MIIICFKNTKKVSFDSVTTYVNHCKSMYSGEIKSPVADISTSIAVNSLPNLAVLTLKISFMKLTNMALECAFPRTFASFKLVRIILILF